MHSNTRSTMYDTIRYEQASLHARSKLLAETRSLSSDLSGEHLISAPPRIDEGGHTKGFPPLRLMIKEPSDPTVLVLQVRRLSSATTRNILIEDGHTRRPGSWRRKVCSGLSKFPIHLLLATHQLLTHKFKKWLTLVRTTSTLFLKIAISLSLFPITFPISVWNLVPLPSPFRIPFNFLIKPKVAPVVEYPPFDHKFALLNGSPLPFISRSVP
jgi:hypothetical protein